MKPLEDITCRFTDPAHWNERDRVHIDNLKLLVACEPVQADDVLKAALWLMTEALRRRETPSFRRGFFRERLKKAHLLASKWSALIQVWPGGNPPTSREIQENTQALNLLRTLTDLAPEDPKLTLS